MPDVLFGFAWLGSPQLRTCAVQVLGDWKWLKESYVLKQNYGARHTCHLCQAVKSGVGPQFDDFGPGALHRATVRSHNDYVSSFVVPPPLTTIPGFHLSMLICDPMHVLHLGVLQWAIGNMLVILAGEGFWGHFAGLQKKRLDKALRVAYGEFIAWCKGRACYPSQGTFNANSVSRGEDGLSFPEFKGKAANSRWIALWLNDVLYRNGPEHELESGLFWGLCEMLHLMHIVPGPWFPTNVACRFARACRVALLSYGALARAARADGLPLWCVKPKHHQLDHLGTVVRTARLHPGFHWAFCDEDFNGRITTVAKACQHPHVFSKRVLEKYSLNVWLGLESQCASPKLPWASQR